MTDVIRAGGNALGLWRRVAAGATPALDPANRAGHPAGP